MVRGTAGLLSSGARIRTWGTPWGNKCAISYPSASPKIRTHSVSLLCSPQADVFPHCNFQTSHKIVYTITYVIYDIIYSHFVILHIYWGLRGSGKTPACTCVRVSNQEASGSTQRCSACFVNSPAIFVSLTYSHRMVQQRLCHICQHVYVIMHAKYP